jgi:hypothetical protein
VRESRQVRSNQNKICLLMTATVDVRGVIDLLRNDPIDRLNDYRWALEQWTQCRGIDGLIFVENSGYDIADLRRVSQKSALHPDSVEFFSFDGQDFPRELGKGYGETLNLQHALSNSRLLASGDYLMVRVNGRNYVENIDVFFETLRAPTEIMCDLNQLLTWGDGRIVGGTVEFFKKYVCPYGHEVDDSKGYYFEHALARAVHRAMSDGLVWRPYPEPPMVRGFSGTSNEDNAENRLVHKARVVRHKVKLRMLRL